MNEKRIYLDHNATSPLRPEVVEEFRSLLGKTFNPSSLHLSGRKTRSQIDLARENVAKLIGAEPSEIIFTSGGTEANHLAWKAFVKPGRKILTTRIEHSCILDAAGRANLAGADLQYVEVGRKGEIPNARSFSRDWDFASIQHANNETGIIHPISDLFRERNSKEGAFAHTDAVQSVGKIEVSVKDLGVDYLTLSAHKLGGLPGSGALYVKKKSPFEVLWAGGSQERQRRTGTESVLGIISLGIVAKLLHEKSEEENHRTKNLRDSFESELKEQVPDCQVVGEDARRLPNTSCLLFEGLDSESLMIAADLEGIDCSTGAACSSGSLEPSHVLLGMGYTAAEAKSFLRFSFGWSSDAQQVEFAVKRLKKLVEQVRSESQKKGRN